MGVVIKSKPPGSERLKSFADRINRLLDEKQGIGADIGDIYTEAKSAGYVPKVLRKAIARQRMDADKRQEEDSILELYEAALDGPTREAVKLAAQGASAREIEAATGIDQATVARSVSLKNKRETPNAAPQNSAPLPVPDGGIGTGPSFAMALGAESIALREAKHAAAADDLAFPAHLDQRKRQVHA